MGLLGGTPGILKVLLGVEVLASCGGLLEEPCFCYYSSTCIWHMQVVPAYAICLQTAAYFGPSKSLGLSFRSLKGVPRLRHFVTTSLRLRRSIRGSGVNCNHFNIMLKTTML